MIYFLHELCVWTVHIQSDECVCVSMSSSMRDKPFIHHVIIYYLVTWFNFYMFLLVIYAFTCYLSSIVSVSFYPSLEYIFFTWYMYSPLLDERLHCFMPLLSFTCYLLYIIILYSIVWALGYSCINYMSRFVLAYDMRILYELELLIVLYLYSYILGDLYTLVPFFVVIFQFIILSC